MADNHLPEEAIWEEGIRQIETTDTVLGGPGGVPNIAPGQLANRTKYLKSELEKQKSELEKQNQLMTQLWEICPIILKL
ncbi:hypothetical protein [Vibrio coralliilyticus]|uniref:hypothetical protein n=1 Tax=Vibrio coralliilyticus TaxID=190893 RepID=UPI0003135A5F|nr:hypothetical protein [Vibrio coralliilyticus]